jgi:hypothetical protein
VGRLEDNLSAELDVEGFAGADAGSMSGLTATPLEAIRALAWFCQPAEGPVAVPDWPITKRWCSKVPPGLRPPSGPDWLRRELVDSVQGKDDAGNPGDAALIDGRDVVPEVVVVDAIDLPVRLIGAGSVSPG